jgi:hypothetical protein
MTTCRSALLTACAALAAAVIPVGAQAATSISFIGQIVIPSGTEAQGTVLGGLSGIDYNPATGSYIAISDDRSQFNPARFYTLDLSVSSGAFTGVAFTGVTTLRQPDGSPYPLNQIDPEAIRFFGANQIIYTSEGEDQPGLGRVASPFVRVANLDGSYVSSLSVPSLYGPTLTSGIRNNLAFESLTSTPNGTIVTATENALKQDGPATGVGVGSPSRIQTFDAGGAPLASFVYQVDPVVLPPNPAGAFATNGLTELLAVSDTRFLAIERSFSTGAPGTGNSIKLYEIDTSGATDVSALAALGGGETPVSKKLVLDLDTLGIPLDNIEGITFGETLDNGKQSLILVSDNNFSGNQFTQFLAFEVNTAVPEPSTWAMMLGGFAAVGAAVRRRKRRPAFA